MVDDIQAVCLWHDIGILNRSFLTLPKELVAAVPSWHIHAKHGLCCNNLESCGCYLTGCAQQKSMC